MKAEKDDRGAFWRMDYLRRGRREMVALAESSLTHCVCWRCRSWPRSRSEPAAPGSDPRRPSCLDPDTRRCAPRTTSDPEPDHCEDRVLKARFKRVWSDNRQHRGQHREVKPRWLCMCVNGGEGGVGQTWAWLLLSRFQGDDDEDGPPVHPAHAAAVAHEVVQNRGELRPHLHGRARTCQSAARKHPPILIQVLHV